MFKKVLYTVLSVVTLLSVAACGSSDSAKEPTKAPKATEAPKDNDKNKNESKDFSSLFDELGDKLSGDEEDDSSVIPTEAPNNSDEDLDSDENFDSDEVIDGDEDSNWNEDSGLDEDFDWEEYFDWVNSDNDTTVTVVSDGIIIDNDQCSFKVLSVDENSRWGYSLEVQVENKTDLNLCFSMDDVYVNDVYCDPYWYCDAEAGETVTSSIDFYGDELEAIGITDVTSITFLLTVYDDDDWNADNLVEGTYVFYPNGEENAVSYEYTLDADDVVLVDNDDATFIILGYEDDELWGYTVNVYIENRTSDNLMFAVNDVAVNGFMCDPYWAAIIPAGMKTYDSIYFSPEDLDACGISTVTIIELLLSVYNYDDYTADSYVEDTFTLYPIGKDKAQYQERAPKDSDIVLFDNDSCSMILTDFTYDDFWGYTATAYIENKTDELLFFSSEEGKINGTECAPSWIESLAPGMKCISEIRWSSYALEESEITEIETLELSVIVNDYSNLENPELVNENFTVTP